jgi:ribosomal protein S18 acetylase RimI-like enzyme
MPLERTPGRAGRVNQLTLRIDDVVVGIATLTQDTDVEVLALVRPTHRRQGIGRDLLGAVAEECLQRGARSFLLVIDERYPGGADFAGHLGGDLEYSEILMELNWSDWRATESDSTIRLERAGERELEELITLRNRDGARETVEAWLRHPANQIWIARKSERAVGMIRLMFTPEVVWLNSFAVLDNLRGQGIGRALLTGVLAGLERSRPILLEVAADNETALRLYRAAGFMEQTRYRYFRVKARLNSTCSDL